MSFFDNIKSSAIKTWQTHQILASIAGGQADLETGTGTSLLSKAPNNNLFGIKASADWNGRTVVMSTSEWNGSRNITVNATFRAYDSPLDSFYDYARFFTSTPWRVENYKHVVGERDYKKASQALQASGYATDPLYAQKLIGRIEKNNLQAWDTEALSGQAVKPVTQNDVLRPITKTVGGPMTDASRANVAKIATTFIGDSLGVGTKPYAQTLITNSNYDVVGSRQLTHATNSLNATHSLQTMKSAGTLKEYIVVIIGTNRGVTASEIDAFVSIAGSGHKILFVDTASQVNHRTSVTSEYRQASMRHANVFHVNWAEYAENMMASYYSKDGANGEYIHMTGAGYKQHAEYIAHALYEASTADFTQTSATDVAREGTSIKDIELQTDGTVSFKGNRVQEDGSTVYVEETTNIGVKGLYSPLGDENIYYPEANQRWGFDDSVNNSLWIEGRYESETTDPVMLLTEGIKELVDRSDPPSQYTISLLDIDPSISIGDTGIFVDHDFNPPLYIQARILNITTSKTNRSLNKVLLGNVTELFPEDKADLLAIQADLRKTTEGIKRDMIDNEPLMMTVTSSNGNVLGDAYQETQISAKLRKGIKDITGDVARVTWERVSNDVAGDVEVNAVLATQTSSTIVIRTADIANNNSKFVVRFYNGANELMETGEIMVKKADTALWTDRDTAPDDARDGAKWVSPDGKQQVKVDGIWEDLVDQSTILAVKGDVENALTEAEQAKADAIASREEAIAEAERLVAEQNAVWQDKMTEYDTQVDGITADIIQAEQKAVEALAQAGVSTDLATVAKNIADQATVNANTAKATADIAKTNANTAKASALEAGEVANQAIADALQATTDATTALDGVTLLTPQVATAVSDASDALTKANTAISDAGKAITDSTNAKNQVGVLSPLVATAVSNASDALTKANSAVADAEKAITDSESALTQVDTLTPQVTSAVSNASSALSKANSALTDSQTAISKANALETTTGTLTTNYNNLTGTVSLKADKTTVDALSGTVNTQGLDITANAGAIAMKADSTTVSAIKGTVDTHTTQIGANATAITSKANTSTVNTLTGRVSTAETTITQQADLIASKANQTEVDTVKGTVAEHTTSITQQAGLIASKANTSTVNALTGRVSTAETSITQQAELIESKASQTEVDDVAGTVAGHTTTLTQHATALTSKASTTSVNTLTGRVSTAETTLTQQADLIASKASQTEVDGVKGTVTSHGTTIGQHATLIESKANTSTVNTLTGRVSTAETSIAQNATAITSKASTSSVNTLTGRVSTAETTLTQQATQISARLTSAQVDTLVTNKGYSTVNYVDNQIVASASGIRADMSLVEGKIDNLQVGGRNLILNSNFSNGLSNWQVNGTATKTTIDGRDVVLTTNVSGRGFYTTPTTLTTNSLYTISFDAKSVGETSKIRVGFLNDPSNNSKFFTVTPTWGRYIYTISQPLSTSNQILHFYGDGSNIGAGAYITNIQLEKGNIASDYSPAPEDTLMQSDFNVFKASYEATAESLTSRLTAIDKVGGRLATAETSITQNATAIASKANTSTVNTLTGRVSTAETTLTQQANLIASKANSLVVDALTGRVSTAETSITQQADLIASKASQTEVDTIKGTVTTQGTSITQNATAIATKANTTTVNTLTGRVTTAETTIGQHATAITSKANTTTVNALTGRVSTAETTITQHATAISARLTDAQVNTLVDNKGFSTVTYVNNQITASASGIRADMSLVEGKIDNLQIGGTNLFNANNVSSWTLVPANPTTGTITKDYSAGYNKTKATRLQSNGNHRFRYILHNTLKESGEYTVSLWYKTLSATRFTIGINDVGLGTVFETGATTEWKKVVFTNNITMYMGVHGFIQFDMSAGSNDVLISDVMVERGNLASEWSPAPEDTLMQNDFNVFKASYEATAEALTSRLTAVDKVGGRLATAESNITQNATGLTQRYTKTETNTLLNAKATTGSVTALSTEISTIAGQMTQRYTKTEVNNLLTNKANTSDLTGLATQTWTNNQITSSASGTMQEITRVENKIPSLTGYATQTWTNNQISATASSITSTISQVESKIDGLQVGGRNLIKDSQYVATSPNNTGLGLASLMTDETIPFYKVTATNNSISTYGFDGTGTVSRWAEHMIVGNTYTVSVDVRVPVVGQVGFMSSQGMQLVNVANTWTRISHTYTYTANKRVIGLTYTGSNTIDYRNWKIEKGNKATDWSPAIEDMATVTALTQATQDLSGFKTLVQNTYGTKTDVSAVTQTANNLVTELTRVENKIPSLTGYATQAWSTTQINTKAGEITTSLTTEINKKATPAQITSAILADKSILDTRATNQTPAWYFTNHPSRVVREFKNTSTMGIGAGTYGVLTTDVPWNGSSGGSVKQNFVDTDGVEFIRRGTTTTWTAWEIMSTNTYVNTTVTQKAGEVTQLISEVKTNPTSTITGYNSLTNNVNSMVQAIGTDGGKIAQMVLTNSAYQTTISDLELKAKFGLGKHMRDDPTFLKGLNGATVYNNSPNTNVVILREYGPGWGQPTESDYRLKITTTGTATPNHGGFVVSTLSRANAQFVVRMIALIPVGRSIEQAHNGVGVGATITWLTSQAGTGKWVEYSYLVQCGSSGSFSTFGFHYLLGGAVPTPQAPLNWYVAKLEIIDVGSSSQSQITQLADSWSLTLKSGEDVKTSINATTNSIRLKADLIHLSGTSLIDNAVIKSAHIETLNANKIVGNTAEFNTIRAGVLTAGVITSTHITSDNALIDKLFATTALITRLTTKTAFINNIKAIEISADKIVGNTAQFIQTAWASLNSFVTIDGGKIKLTNTAGDFVEMNNIPEFRSQDTAGTATIMGKGRTHYYGINNAVATARFYIGTSLEGTGTHGIHIAKGQTFGIYRNSDSYGGTPAQYHVVKSGESWRSVTDLYYTTSTSVYIIGNLNGRDPATNYLQIGETIIVRPAVPGNQSGVERLWTMGTATSGATRLYSHVEHIFENRIEVALRARFLIPALFEQGFTNNSDRRIKHDIQPSQVTALEHIASLSFKEYRLNSSGKHVPIGIIAQDSGILRVKGEDAGDMEGVDGYLMPMLALKGVQELQAIVKQQAETIKQLEELIHEELRNR